MRTKENRYFDFLCNIVGRSQEYSILLDELHGIEYYSLIPNDDNRGEDGKQFRLLFLDEMDRTGPSYLPNGGCTVLEMLIGLAYRLEFESIQSKWEKGPNEWFWILIDNLGLRDWTNDEYHDRRDSSRKVHTIICNMVARNYEPDGNGGLFPLKDPKKDQRRVEIWYQMTQYIMENYQY